jgi:hypothetical protein
MTTMIDGGVVLAMIGLKWSGVATGVAGGEISERVNSGRIDVAGGVMDGGKIVGNLLITIGVLKEEKHLMWNSKVKDVVFHNDVIRC